MGIITELIQKRIPFVVIHTTTMGIVDRFVAISHKSYKKSGLRGFEACEGRLSVVMYQIQGADFLDFMSHQKTMKVKDLGSAGAAFFVPELELNRTTIGDKSDDVKAEFERLVRLGNPVQKTVHGLARKYQMTAEWVGQLVGVGL